MAVRNDDGSFKMRESKFRNYIAVGGRFPPEKGRYHLYVSYACPWAHRALIVWALKGLEDIIDVSIANPQLLDGWRFVPSDRKVPNDERDVWDFPGATVDKVYGTTQLSDLYHKADPTYDGRYTVPVLWDTREATIVNNESSEVVRSLASGFDSILPASLPASAIDLYPEHLRAEIDATNAWVHRDINVGVYKVGFATTQQAYDVAIRDHVAGMARVEALLSDGREWLVGGAMTEADVRLFTSIIRYDPVYVVAFKTNYGLVRHDYPYLHHWLKKMYWTVPACKDTTHWDHLKAGYHWVSGKIPIGPNNNIEALTDDEG
ncbi:S-glutathionyl-(chloro)hydroquinone reductase [Apiotrichum porosum]|uniref:S-glutathionyl-(Chloro)hydroquinone reductase n=1 Tax=Apiotrichum porosum TaxID=105984 RepID=A0A427XP44_9TREE|nr:S-glutathionyl-(chloro)hydroquinone reductase [Apiotrichum porosum]RSH80594.1 S-glutathionyl-(chloro)hydroquinone reductase [Apiotrichum porosum]